ncbi:MAG: type II toxin-antitoxin system PemK/MazF family toxin [bacterium]
MIPKRGEIWWVNFEPSVGTEIKKTRPALIISNNMANEKSTRITVIPMTSRIIDLPIVVIVEADKNNNLSNTSLIKIPDLATFDKSRLKGKIGVLSNKKLVEVQTKLKIHLSL